MTAEPTWFSSLESTLDDPESSRLDRGEWRASDTPDSRFLSRQARRIASEGSSAFSRLYRAFVSARAALGLLLFGTSIVIALVELRPRTELVALCGAYAFATTLLWMLPRWPIGQPGPTATRLRRRQFVATIGLDLATFGSLHMLTAGGGPISTAALLVMPVLMSGVLTPRLQALGVTAAATLVLLSQSLVQVWAGQEVYVEITRAGLAGAGLFVVSLLAHELAGRLAREELTARGSLEMARQQAQLNRLVIEEMQEGVLVVDRRLKVRAANPAARALLGHAGGSASFALDDRSGWSQLGQAVREAVLERSWPDAGRDIALTLSDGEPRRLRLRMRFMRRRATAADGGGEEMVVLLVEDLHTVQSRLRQEKLAAMGRVSAGIAHEIRNPLAAIAQANALLAEDVADPQQRQLVDMIADNAKRLQRIVDDVMEVAPGALADPPPLDITAQVAAACSEWARTCGLALGEASALRVELPEQPVGVVFDADHLRRVLVNLLDNALRHGSGQPGAVWVRVAQDGDELVRLLVASDGAPIPPEIERHLFEPFFSSRSRGTGLGLYICRELCERYGAGIEYQLRPASSRHRNAFWVTMRRAALPATEPRLHL
ncbi:sensor histidine kinase [Caldimonas sp. KR1-144]|uniref:sensor histidine kinase n=1 Tax=Caldimonas sp. KR1-144 TaxID=3400911 RepID=UPI003C0815D9